MNKQFLTLNPSYILRQDGNRVILCGDESTEYKSEDWFSFIHPYYGMLLSFFTNNLTAEEKIINCAKYFNRPKEYISEIIAPLIDNNLRRTLYNKKGTTLYFPKNTLISSSKPINRSNIYTASDFKYLGVPDLNSNRLAYPLNINLELTMKCYTNCIYCYANRDLPSYSNLSTSRIIELIHEAQENKVKNFDINGGEVMLHPDIKLILKELTHCGFKPLVSTKIPLSQSKLDFLHSIGINKIQISLDSSDEKTLTKLLGTRIGYLNNILESLSYASKIGLNVDINTVLTKYNSSLQQIEDLLSLTSSFNCVRRHRLNPVGFSLYKHNFEEIKPSSESLDLIEQNIDNWKDKFKLDINLSYYECETQFKPINKETLFNDRAICTGNVWNIVILPNGDVTICEELYSNKHFIIGNVSNTSINDIWTGEKALNLYNFTLSKDSNSECKNCDAFNSCHFNKGVCWKTILMAYGEQNWDFPDPRCPKAPFPYHTFFY